MPGFVGTGFSTSPERYDSVAAARLTLVTRFAELS